MNSMAQQAVPKGSGQRELPRAQSASLSNCVVIQDSPTIAWRARAAASLSACDWEEQRRDPYS